MKLELLVGFLIIFTSTVRGGQIYQVQVVSEGNRFEPSRLDIKLGDSVKWVWSGGEHLTTSDVEGSANSWDHVFGSGADSTFVFTPTTTGTFRYYDKFNGLAGGWGMTGEITVTSPPTTGTTSTGTTGVATTGVATTGVATTGVATTGVATTGAGTTGEVACSPECDQGYCSGGVCVCDEGYKGNDCAEPVCSPSCQNGGDCVGPNECDCAGTGFDGASCEKSVCDDGNECSEDVYDNGSCFYSYSLPGSCDPVVRVQPETNVTVEITDVIYTDDVIASIHVPSGAIQVNGEPSRIFISQVLELGENVSFVRSFSEKLFFSVFPLDSVFEDPIVMCFHIGCPAREIVRNQVCLGYLWNNEWGCESELVETSTGVWCGEVTRHSGTFGLFEFSSPPEQRCEAQVNLNLGNLCDAK